MKLDKGTPPSASDCEMFEDRFTRCRHLLHFVAVRILGSEHDGEKASGKKFVSNRDRARALTAVNRHGDSRVAQQEH